MIASNGILTDEEYNEWTWLTSTALFFVCYKSFRAPKGAFDLLEMNKEQGRGEYDKMKGGVSMKLDDRGREEG